MDDLSDSATDGFATSGSPASPSSESSACNGGATGCGLSLGWICGVMGLF